MRYAAILLAAAATSCMNSEPPPNRHESPEAALSAARRAVSAKDLPGYLDTLTESYVRVLMANSIAECIYQNHPAVAARSRPWKGCQDILAEAGWTKDLGSTPQAFKSAADQIRDPRRLYAALESSRGTKLAWDHLDPIKVSELVVSGKTARATAEWKTGGAGPIIFEKDDTGWRMNPHLEPR